MKQLVLSLCFAFLVCGVQFVSLNDTKNPMDTGHTAKSDTATVKDVGKPADSMSPPVKPHYAGDNNSTNCEGNSTVCKGGSSGYLEKLSDLYEKGTIKRAFYVLIGITAIVVIYFVIRTIKSKRRRSKSKKYGVISMPGNDLEMAPLDADDDEDDVTVFEVNGHK